MARRETTWLQVWLMAAFWTVVIHFNWHHPGDPLWRDIARVAYTLPMSLFIYASLARLMPWQRRQR